MWRIVILCVLLPTLGSAVVSQDGNGWTVVTPSGDSRVIYVSSSDGDDADDGLSAANAKATIAAGVALMRHEFPDHLLLKAGDEWNEPLGAWATSGRSSTEPQLISYYGSGARPRLITDNNDSCLRFSGGGGTPIMSHVFLIGVHCHAAARDLDAAEFAGKAAGVGGISVASFFVENLLVEDVKIEAYDEGAVIQCKVSSQDACPLVGVIIRRSIIVDSYSTTGHSQGMFFFGMRNLLLEDNVLDKNGWADDRDDATADGGATIFNHNLYIQYDDNMSTVVRGNISSRAASHGLQLRPGGLVFDNLFVLTPLPLLLGGRPGTANNVATLNVVTKSEDISTAILRESGIQSTNDATGGASQVSGNFRFLSNLIIHETDTAQYGFQFNELGPPSDPYSGDFEVIGNAIASWSNGNVTGNKVPTKSENNIFTSGTIEGSNRDAADVTFTAPNRTIETYDASLGGPGTFDSFITRLRDRPLNTSSEIYSARHVNNYLRAGFCEVGVTDNDGDGLCDFWDNCDGIYNPNQTDVNFDGVGDACEKSGRGMDLTGGMTQ